MAMSPEEKQEFENLKRIVRNLQDVTDVPFIESSKRRIAIPAFQSLGITEAIEKEATGGTSGVHKSVNEAGTSSYSVADAYDGTITVRDANGNFYKLGYYTA